MLIFFRVVQGATGGALQPLSQAVMLEAFPPQDRGKAMAFWGLGIVVAPDARSRDRRLAHRQFQLALGLLYQSAGRPCIGHHDAPVHLRSALHCGAQKRGIDYWGIGMLALGVGALQVVLDKGQEEDWFAANWIVVPR